MNDDGLLHRLDERSKHIDEKIDMILEQTTKTNGTVQKHDERLTKLETWKAVIGGQKTLVLWAIGAIGTAVGFLLKHILA